MRIKTLATVTLVSCTLFGCSLVASRHMGLINVTLTDPIASVTSQEGYTLTADLTSPSNTQYVLFNANGKVLDTLPLTSGSQVIDMAPVYDSNPYGSQGGLFASLELFGNKYVINTYGVTSGNITPITGSPVGFPSPTWEGKAIALANDYIYACGQDTSGTGTESVLYHVDYQHLSPWSSQTMSATHAGISSNDFHCTDLSVDSYYRSRVFAASGGSGVPFITRYSNAVQSTAYGLDLTASFQGDLNITGSTNSVFVSGNDASNSSISKAEWIDSSNNTVFDMVNGDFKHLSNYLNDDNTSIEVTATGKNIVTVHGRTDSYGVHVLRFEQ